LVPSQPSPATQDQTVEALAQETGDRRFAFDSYRRFVQTYAVTVLTKRPELRRRFEKVMERAKQRREAGENGWENGWKMDGKRENLWVSDGHLWKTSH
jgi:hypothetical protein